MNTITADDTQSTFHEEYDLYLGPDQTLAVEYRYRTDWDGLTDPCPECDGTEFDHIQYEGGHYGQVEGTVIERTDYWDQKGSLYTACKECDEILFKSPAYDVLQALEDGVFE